MTAKLNLDESKEGDLIKITLHSLVEPTIMVYKKLVDGKPHCFIEHDLVDKSKIIVYKSDFKKIIFRNDEAIELNPAHTCINKYCCNDTKYDEYKQLLINSKLWKEN